MDVDISNSMWGLSQMADMNVSVISSQDTIVRSTKKKKKKKNSVDRKSLVAEIEESGIL